MAEGKVRVGVIGVGAISVMNHIPQLRDDKRAEIVAVSRRDEKKLRIAQKAFEIPEAYTDWREMIEKSRLDAVVVATPNNLHAELAIAALESGLDVLVEKPMSISSEDAKAMVDASERTGKLLMVTYQYRLTGVNVAARRAIENGVIGEVRQIDAALTGYRRWWIWEEETFPEPIREIARKRIPVPETFFGDWSLEGDYHRDPARAGGGLFVALGSHVVDLALWMADVSPVEVFAFRDELGHPMECYLNVQARLSNGAICSVSSADVRSKNYFDTPRNRIEIVGDDGTVVIDRDLGALVRKDGEDTAIEADGEDRTVVGAFLDAIVDGAENPAPPREALRQVQFTEAAYRSIAERAMVPIAAT